MERPAMERILNPAAIAIVGASAEPGKRGYRILKQVIDLGYEGEVYPVNPTADTILGVPVYASVSEIPGAVDLAFVAIPKKFVPGVVEECGEHGVAGAVIVSAGFSESGEEGSEKEAELVRIAREHGVRLIGPNVNGIANHHEKLLLATGRPGLYPGGIAVISQSGNMDIRFSKEAADRGGMGFSFNIGIGNESDLEFHEFLPFLEGDPNTRVVTLYVEGMADGRAFLEAAVEFVRKKPIVALKAAVTEAGERSAISHTDSLSGDSDVVDAVYRQAGVVKVERADEWYPVTETLGRIDPPAGGNVAIVTSGGGAGTLLVDSLVGEGLSVPSLAAGTQEALADRLPQSPNVTNPVDVVGGSYDLSSFLDVTEAVIGDPGIDSVLLSARLGGFGTYEGGLDDRARTELEVVEGIAALVEESGKPVIVHTDAAREDNAATAALRDADIPFYESLNVVTTCVAKAVDYGRHLAVADEKSTFEFGPDPGGHSVIEAAVADGRTTLSEVEVKRALEDAGLPVLPFRMATTAEDAAEAAASFGGPVSLKVVSRDIVHKSDVGGVSLDIVGEEAILDEYGDLLRNVERNAPDAEVEGVIISPMVEASLELIVGVTTDVELGKVLMFGLGGMYAEVLSDVSFRGLPVTRFDASEMIEEIRGSALLDGYRGDPAVDRDELVSFLTGVSEFIADNRSIRELDLNPVAVTPAGLSIVDAAAVLE